MELEESGVQLFQQGAEARVYLSTFYNKPCIIKERFAKGYRHPSLDEKLRTRRTSQEVRSMTKCRKAGIRTPTVYSVDNVSCKIIMEHISESNTVRNYINNIHQHENVMTLSPVAETIGQILAAMHDLDIIHGDLTTSNMLLTGSTENQFQITMIDFGLSYCSGLTEHKGVDLYVLEKAFLSTHPQAEDLFGVILSSYKKTSGKSAEVIKKLDEVRLRGRKRTMIG